MSKNYVICSVTIDGPSKCTIDAYEVDVGYKVRYTPMAPGDYYVTTKVILRMFSRLSSKSDENSRLRCLKYTQESFLLKI